MPDGERSGAGRGTTIADLIFEQEATDVLGIPYQEVMQAGLIPVAYTLGMDFKPAAPSHWSRCCTGTAGK